jgi:hypothetical protein
MTTKNTKIIIIIIIIMLTGLCEMIQSARSFMQSFLCYVCVAWACVHAFKFSPHG